MITRTSLCSDCLINYETNLRVLGIYDIYEKYRLATYELGHLRDLRLKLKETIEYFTKTDGDVSTIPESEYDAAVVWKNTNKDKILTDALADLKKTEDLIEKGTPMTADFKQKYIAAVAAAGLKDIISR